MQQQEELYSTKSVPRLRLPQRKRNNGEQSPPPVVPPSPPCTIEVPGKSPAPHTIMFPGRRSSWRRIPVWSGGKGFYFGVDRAVRWTSVVLLAIACVIAFSILWDMALYQPHANTEWLDTGAQGQIYVDGDVTAQIARIWHVDTSTKCVYYLKLVDHLNTTYRLDDAAVGSTLHVKETIHVHYRAQQGDIVDIVLLQVV